MQTLLDMIFFPSLHLQDANTALPAPFPPHYEAISQDEEAVVRNFVAITNGVTGE